MPRFLAASKIVPHGFPVGSTIFFGGVEYMFKEVAKKERILLTHACERQRRCSFRRNTYFLVGKFFWKINNKRTSAINHFSQGPTLVYPIFPLCPTVCAISSLVHIFLQH
jgi:hypothetical protein